MKKILITLIVLLVVSLILADDDAKYRKMTAAELGEYVINYRNPDIYLEVFPVEVTGVIASVGAEEDGGALVMVCVDDDVPDEDAIIIFYQFGHKGPYRMQLEEFKKLSRGQTATFRAESFESYMSAKAWVRTITLIDAILVVDP
jgi:GTP-sensing pleiotropic transcriptional regulator CodY